VPVCDPAALPPAGQGHGLGPGATARPGGRAGSGSATGSGAARAFKFKFRVSGINDAALRLQLIISSALYLARLNGYY